MFKKKTPDEDDAKPRRRIGMVLGLAVLSVVVGVTVAAVFGGSQLRAMWAGDRPQSDTAAMDGETPAPRSADHVVMPFDEMIVNIATATGSGLQTNRFMRLDLALVYDRTLDTAGLVETRHIYMRDAFHDYLRHLSDRDIEGTLGLAILKSELLRRARAIAGNSAPHEILIMELVVQ